MQTKEQALKKAQNALQAAKDKDEAKREVDKARKAASEASFEEGKDAVTVLKKLWTRNRCGIQTKSAAGDVLCVWCVLGT